VQQLWSAN